MEITPEQYQYLMQGLEVVARHLIQEVRPDVVEPVEEDVIQPRRKNKGKREADLKDLLVEVIVHTMVSQQRRSWQRVL